MASEMRALSNWGNVKAYVLVGAGEMFINCVLVILWINSEILRQNEMRLGQTQSAAYGIPEKYLRIKV